ncbi:MAG: hypothetical protein EZS28_020958, partial [Streblomastix strix]
MIRWKLHLAALLSICTNIPPDSVTLINFEAMFVKFFTGTDVLHQLIMQISNVTQEDYDFSCAIDQFQEQFISFRYSNVQRSILALPLLTFRIDATPRVHEVKMIVPCEYIWFIVDFYQTDNVLKEETETQGPQLRLSKNLKNRELIVTHVKNQVTVQPFAKWVIRFSTHFTVENAPQQSDNNES